jgi:hypothetical protein
MFLSPKGERNMSETRALCTPPQSGAYFSGE